MSQVKGKKEHFWTQQINISVNSKCLLPMNTAAYCRVWMSSMHDWKVQHACAF